MGLSLNHCSFIHILIVCPLAAWGSNWLVLWTGCSGSYDLKVISLLTRNNLAWHITGFHATLVNTHTHTHKVKCIRSSFSYLKYFPFFSVSWTVSRIFSPLVFSRWLSLFWLISKVTLLLEFDTFCSLHIAPSIAALFTSPLLILLSRSS